MAYFPPIVAGFSFLQAPSFPEAVRQFITERSMILHFFEVHWESFVAWLSQPAVLAIIIAWALTFTLVTAFILTLGFGPVGVVAGSTAAAFQAFAYGGFTPAAGVFATLTSLAMLGLLMPVAVIVAACIATAVAIIVWALV